MEVSNKTVEVEVRNVCAAENGPKEESRIDLLTRVQGSNDWKSTAFNGKKKLPGYTQTALAELHALT